MVDKTGEGKMSLATYPLIISIIQCKTFKDLNEIQNIVLDSELEIIIKIELTILINQKIKELSKVFER